MRLLLDENCASRALAVILRDAGHTVETVGEALGLGASDSTIILYAMSHDFVVLTKDADDFRMAALANAAHSGIIVIYEDRTHPSLRYKEIATALNNVEMVYAVTAGLLLALNQFIW